MESPLHARAKLLIDLGKPDAAIDVLREALRKDPMDHRALYMFGHCELLKGRFEKALLLADQAIAIEPNKAGSWLLKANTELYLNELPTALRSIDEAIRHAPHHADCYAIKGAVLLRRLEKGHALIALDEALRCDPENVQALSLRSLALSISDQHQLAAEEVERALRTAPDNARALATRSWGEFVSGRISTAKEGFRAALRQDPADGLGRIGLKFTLSAWPGYQAWTQRISTRLQVDGGTFAILAQMLLFAAYITAMFRFLLLDFHGEDLLLPFLAFILATTVPMMLLPKLLLVRLLFIREGPGLLVAWERSTLIITALLTSLSITWFILTEDWSASGLVLYLAVLVSGLPIGERPRGNRVTGLVLVLTVGVLSVFFAFGTADVRIGTAIVLTLVMFGYPICARRKQLT